MRSRPAAAGGWAAGVSTQAAPWKRSARAASAPRCSDPAMGCPGITRPRFVDKLASSARRCDLVLPTSVRMADGFAACARASTSARARTGVAATTRSAPSAASSTERPRSVSASMRNASRSSRRSASTPTTSGTPASRAASPTDAPSSPVPTIASRRGHLEVVAISLTLGSLVRLHCTSSLRAHVDKEICRLSDLSPQQARVRGLPPDRGRGPPRDAAGGTPRGRGRSAAAARWRCVPGAAREHRPLPAGGEPRACAPRP